MNDGDRGLEDWLGWVDIDDDDDDDDDDGMDDFVDCGGVWVLFGPCSLF